MRSLRCPGLPFRRRGMRPTLSHAASSSMASVSARADGLSPPWGKLLDAVGKSLDHEAALMGRWRGAEELAPARFELRNCQRVQLRDLLQHLAAHVSPLSPRTRVRDMNGSKWEEHLVLCSPRPHVPAKAAGSPRRGWRPPRPAARRESSYLGPVGDPWALSSGPLHTGRSSETSVSGSCDDWNGVG